MQKVNVVSESFHFDRVPAFFVKFEIAIEGNNRISAGIPILLCTCVCIVGLEIVPVS